MGPEAAQKTVTHGENGESKVEVLKRYPVGLTVM